MRYGDWIIKFVLPHWSSGDGAPVSYHVINVPIPRKGDHVNLPGDKLTWEVSTVGYDYSAATITVDLRSP